VGLLAVGVRVVVDGVRGDLLHLGDVVGEIPEEGDGLVLGEVGQVGAEFVGRVGDPGHREILGWGSVCARIGGDRNLRLGVLGRKATPSMDPD
jgi:hypothetical protein